MVFVERILKYSTVTFCSTAFEHNQNQWDNTVRDRVLNKQTFI